MDVNGYQIQHRQHTFGIIRLVFFYFSQICFLFIFYYILLHLLLFLSIQQYIYNEISCKGNLRNSFINLYIYFFFHLAFKYLPFNTITLFYTIFFSTLNLQIQQQKKKTTTLQILFSSLFLALALQYNNNLYLDIYYSLEREQKGRQCRLLLLYSIKCQFFVAVVVIHGTYSIQLFQYFQLIVGNLSITCVLQVVSMFQVDTISYVGILYSVQYIPIKVQISHRISMCCFFYHFIFYDYKKGTLD